VRSASAWEGKGPQLSRTDLSVADRAQRLKVLQGALSSSAVDGLDVVDLPELAFCRVGYDVVQLQQIKEATVEALDTPSQLHMCSAVRTGK